MPPGPDVVQLLRAEIDIGIDAIDALDRKMALIPPILGTVAALLLPNPILARQFALAGAAAAVTLGAIAIAIAGLAGTAISIGPEQSWLSEQTDAKPETFYREVADRQRMSIDALHCVTRRKSKRFNLALVSASLAMLLFLAVRFIPGS